MTIKLLLNFILLLLSIFSYPLDHILFILLVMITVMHESVKVSKKNAPMGINNSNNVDTGNLYLQQP